MRKIKIIEKPSMDKARLRVCKASSLFYDYIPTSELLENLKKKKYLIKTYGCQANIRDEEVISGLLEQVGMIKTSLEDEADLIILNTCSVRENADDKVYAEVGDLSHLKKKKKDLIIAICGCMIEQIHVVEKLTKTFEYIDILYGTHNIKDFIEILDEFIKLKREVRIVKVSSKEGDIIEGLPSKRLSSFKAFVNITYGCDKFCTYCIVPYTRGKERSRDLNDILNECRELVANGYQEITLLGQNVDSYGKDLESGIDFAYLLEEVAKLGIPRLRFLTSYPSDFKDNVIDVIAKYPNIMKFIHLPFQAGNNNILRAMGRRYSYESYLELINKIKAKVPGCTFSTDIIVGFPNETYEEFLDTIKLCNEVGFTSAFTFIYSPRIGTPAAKIIDHVPYEEKIKRFKELLDSLEIRLNDLAQEMVGKTYPVLVEGYSKKNKEVLSGFLEKQKVVHFKGDLSLVGKIVQVKILENHAYSLNGELISE